MLLLENNNEYIFNYSVIRCANFERIETIKIYKIFLFSIFSSQMKKLKTIVKKIRTGNPFVKSMFKINKNIAYMAFSLWRAGLCLSLFLLPPLLCKK